MLYRPARDRATVRMPTEHASGVVDVDDSVFRLLVESTPHIVWMTAPDGSTEYVNRHGRVYAGPPFGVTGLDWTTLLHDDDLDLVGRARALADRTCTPYRVDCRIRRSDGSYRWHHVTGFPIHGGPGGVKWIGTADDVDDVRTREAAVRSGAREAAQNLALLETLHSNAPVGFGFVDRDFRRVLVNETLAAFNGSTVAEQVGRLVPDLVPLVWPRLAPLYRKVLETGCAVDGVEVVGPSQAHPLDDRNWLLSYYPVRVDGEVTGIGIVAVDTTDRVRSERLHRQLSAIVENSGDAILGATTEGVITSWNAAAQRLFGYAGDEVIGRSMAVLAGSGRLPEQRRSRLVAGGPTERYESVCRCKDGTLVDVLISASSTTDEAGVVTGLSMIVQDISERIATQRALEASALRLEQAQRIAHLGSFEVDAGTQEMTWSAEHYRILGIDQEVPASGELFLSVVHPDDLPALSLAWRAAVNESISADISYRIVRADNSQERTLTARFAPELGPDGSVVRLAGTVMDDTDRLTAEQERRTAESRFEVAFEQAGIGAGILGLDGIPTRINAAGCAILGRSAKELTGTSWTPFNHPDELPLGEVMLPRLANGHDTYSAERRFIRPDGSVVWTALHVTLARQESGAPWYYLAQLQDITESKRISQELEHQALHDSLTGLPNRALLNDRLLQGQVGARRRGSQLGVIFLDIDNFKVVNVSVGHSKGDELLIQAACRIRAVIRESDTVARFGGDEFVIVCDHVSSQETTLIGERILESMRVPFFSGATETTATASIGIAIAEEGATPENLLQDAVAAMYLAKSRGRDRLELFTEVLRSRAQQWMASTSALRHALDRAEFLLHYQPVVDLCTGALLSAEALLRWKHPQRGFVSPDEFIPLAEESGLIVPIGAWVLGQACEQLAQWRRTDPSMTVAVNLSVRQIQSPGLVDMVANVLARTGIPAGSLCLELTESIFMNDADYFGETLLRLRSLGVRLSIDDFGTGFSSLSYLKRFPVDAVKVDKSFVDGLGADPHDSALVAAIVAMADALGLIVTAEGVENLAQLGILRRLQCHRGQGFYLAQPMTGNELERLVRHSHHWVVD
ncbi:MAG: EAL domain-containing protein [Nakamurella sp.]